MRSAKMLMFKGITLNLLVFVFITLKLTYSLSLYKNKKLPLDIEVVNPSEFVIHLSEQERGTLVKLRVNINEDLSTDGVAHFEKDKADGHTLRFFDDNLNLKASDIIYYSGLFKDEDGHHEEEGSYIFNGAYTNSRRDKRDVVESNSYEDSSDEDSDSNPIETRFGHHRRRDYDRRHGHEHGHGRGHGHGHGRGHGRGHGHEHEHEHEHGLGPPHGRRPLHFGPPGPHHGSFGPPPYHHGPGPWNGHGHGPKDRFDNSGPWDGHDDDDDYTEQFGRNNKPWNHRGDHSNKHHRFNNSKPWGGEESDSGNVGNPNNGSNGLVNNFDNDKPNEGSNSENNGLVNNNSNSVNNDSKDDETNDVEIKLTTIKPPSTERTSAVPNIDIRFSEVKND